jgi:RNA polymerase sigma factor (sigma-70 family)
MIVTDKQYDANEILEGIKLNNDNVLTYIYKKYYKEIQHYIIKNSGNEEDARDVFQEALIVIYRKLKNNELHLTCAFNTYLYAVCRYLWLKTLNKDKNNIMVEMDDQINDKIIDEDLVNKINENEKFALYQKHFEKLEEDCKKILKLFVNKTSLKEIAAIMGYKSEKYAKKRKFLCKEYLINSIQKDPNFKHL